MHQRTGRFSRAESREIEERYAIVPTQRIAASLNRSVRSVERAARALFEEKPMQKGPWSEAEIERLLDSYGGCDEKALQLILRRTADDIESKVRELRKAAQGRREPLTRVEIVRLKRVYGTRSPEALEVVFGREAEMVEEVAKELLLAKDKSFICRSGGTSKMPRWTDAEIEILKREYPLKSNVEIARDLGRSVKSVVSKAHTLQLKKSGDRLREMGRQNVRNRYDN